MDSRYLFIFSHDAQIDWYVVFAEAFQESGPGRKTVLFVHGAEDAARGRKLGCYDLVVDLLEGFAFDEGRPAASIPIHPEILRMEEEVGASFLWEDLRTDRWARARQDPAYLLQYVNHAFSVVLEAYAQLDPVAALGEYTMALYRLVFRHFQRAGRPMLYPITTRYFKRLYFETNLYWEWERCIELYQRYLNEGIPPEVEAAILPAYEAIALKYARPNYTAYQNNFSTGFTQVRALSLGQALRKVGRAFQPVDERAARTNLRHALAERGPLQKVGRMIGERTNLRAYNSLTSPSLPAGLDYAVYFLHYQPEYTSDGLGKFYAEQQFLIRNIASSLPAGTFLVVKEHPTMVGLRDPGFYEHIKSSPNVILVHHGFDSVELIKGSRMVFTIVGTPALEAMFVGKPAIMFGRYAFASTNLISFCPDFWSLNGLIREKLRQVPDPADVRRHGMALLAAKHEASRPGQIPIAVELIAPFLAEQENFDTVKRSFQEELASLGVS